MVEEKFEFPELIKAIHNFYRKSCLLTGTRPKVWIEDKASGQSALQTLKNPVAQLDGSVLPALPVRAWVLPGNWSKEARADHVTVFPQAGLCYLPFAAAWKDRFIEQHHQFPKGKTDDIVDTTTMALYTLGDKKQLARMEVITQGLDITNKVSDNKTEERQLDIMFRHAQRTGWF
jgi:predicted phage terminase large subunit-like protein